LPGDVPSPSKPPAGCKFHPRCRYAKEICSREAPAWRAVSPDHWTACHLADDLKLAGVASA
jgi:oligopeptide/dipeptide ABC transporter ATP-binding protein